MRIEHADADVQRVVVVKNSYLRGIGRRGSDLGVALSEISRRSRRSPCGLVQLSVDVDCAGAATRTHDAYAAGRGSRCPRSRWRSPGGLGGIRRILGERV